MTPAQFSDLKPGDSVIRLDAGSGVIRHNTKGVVEKNDKLVFVEGQVKIQWSNGLSYWYYATDSYKIGLLPNYGEYSLHFSTNESAAWSKAVKDRLKARMELQQAEERARHPVQMDDFDDVLGV